MLGKSRFMKRGAVPALLVFAVTAACGAQSTTSMPAVTRAGGAAHNTRRTASGYRPTPSGAPPVTETVYIADPANQEIFEFSGGHKNPIAASIPAQTGNVTGIARHSSGFIFALDAAGAKSVVNIFDSQLGPVGAIPPQDLPLVNPVGIAMDKNDDVFVGDNLTSSLVVYELPVVSATGTPGGAKSTFTLPATLPTGSNISGVAVNQGGKFLYVATNTWGVSGGNGAAFHSNVSIFKVATGTLVNSFDVSFPYNSEGGADAVGIAGDAGGNSYLVYSSTDLVSDGLLQVWSKSGTMITTLPAPDPHTMNAVALDPAGDVLSINGYWLGQNFGDNTPPTIARESTGGINYEALPTNGTKNPTGIVGAPRLQSSQLRLYAADNSIAAASGYQGPLTDSTTVSYTFNLPNIIGQFGHQTGYGIAIDPTEPNGTIYVSSTDTVNQATEIDAFARPTSPGSFNPIERISAGLLYWQGQIAFDQNGDLFIPVLELVSPTAEVIERVHGSGFANSYQPIIVSGLSFPQCVAIDSAANLYVVDQVYNGQYQNNLYEYTPSGGVYPQTPTNSLLNVGYGASCAYDPVLSEVFLTERNKVVGYDSSLNVKKTINPTLNAGEYLNGLGFDTTGMLYLGTTSDTVLVIPPSNFGTGTPTVTFNSTGDGYPSAVAQIVIGD